MQKTFGRIVAKSPQLGARQILVVASTQTRDREGDVMLMSGVDLSEYRANPIVLRGHDHNRPIGNADVSVKNGRLEALITFAPEGASECADETCALAKSGVLRAVSVGFLPLASEPIKGGGRRFTEWKLLEISLVAVPANQEALVVARNSPVALTREQRMREIEVLGLRVGPMVEPVAAKTLPSRAPLSKSERLFEIERLRYARR